MPLGKLSTAWNVHLYNVNSDCSYPRKSLSTSVRRYDSFLEDTLTSLAGDWATGQPLPTFHPIFLRETPASRLGGSPTRWVNCGQTLPTHRAAS
jgi:hypothetical protein